MLTEQFCSLRMKAYAALSLCAMLCCIWLYRYRNASFTSQFIGNQLIGNFFGAAMSTLLTSFGLFCSRIFIHCYFEPCRRRNGLLILCRFDVKPYSLALSASSILSPLSITHVCFCVFNSCLEICCFARMNSIKRCLSFRSCCRKNQVGTIFVNY